jgi:hypothetical protein
MEIYTVGMGGTGMTLAIVIAILLFMKSKQMKQMNDNDRIHHDRKTENNRLIDIENAWRETEFGYLFQREERFPILFLSRLWRFTPSEWAEPE